jgi:hypothetical protein
MDIPWYKDISVLAKNMDEFVPVYGMSSAKILNSVTRLLIYVFLINYCLNISPLIIFMIVITIILFANKNSCNKEGFDTDFNDEIPVKYTQINLEDETKIPINSQSIKELQAARMNIHTDPYNLYAGYNYMHGLNGSTKKIFEQRRVASGNFSGSPKYSAPPICNYIDEKSNSERNKFFSASRRNYKS